ncbi:MAG: hypothetical protein KDE55_08210 [Novosphingobium sp.]|nr:hypothetical protein [Novosphingobium sp.]
MDWKLTTVAACRVAGLDRQRFNEYVAAGEFPCAPDTIPGRARLFDHFSLLSLMLFKSLMDDGLSPRRAGHIACSVSSMARNNPAEDTIAYIETAIGICRACIPSEVPPQESWNSVAWSGSTITKVTAFNVEFFRTLIDERVEEERTIVGPEDPAE